MYQSFFSSTRKTVSTIVVGSFVVALLYVGLMNVAENYSVELSEPYAQQVNLTPTPNPANFLKGSCFGNKNPEVHLAWVKMPGATKNIISRSYKSTSGQTPWVVLTTISKLDSFIDTSVSAGRIALYSYNAGVETPAGSTNTVEVKTSAESCRNPNVTVKSPVSGEVLEAGVSTNIALAVTLPDKLVRPKIKLVLVRVGSGALGTIVEYSGAVSPNTIIPWASIGSYTNSNGVPQTATNYSAQYKIRAILLDVNKKLYQVDGGSFKLTPPTQIPKITFITPIGGEVIPAGPNNYMVEWILSRATSLHSPGYVIELLQHNTVLGFLLKTGPETPIEYYENPALWNFSWAPGSYNPYATGTLTTAPPGTDFALRATLFDGAVAVFEATTAPFSISQLPTPTPTTGIDFVLENITFPSSGDVGKEVTLGFSIINRGTATFFSERYGNKGIAWSVDYLNSGNGYNATSRVISEGCQVPINLVPGAGCQVVLGLTFNEAGAKTVTIFPDYANDVQETNETNNIARRSISIAAPLISVSSPRGGEKIGAGGFWNIVWNSWGIPIGNLVNINLLKGGNLFRSIGTTAYNGNPSSFLWSVPSDISGTDFQVQVWDTSSTTLGRSATSFSIIQGNIKISRLNDGTPPGGSINSGARNAPILKYSITNNFDKEVDIVNLAVRSSGTATPGEFENIYFRDGSTGVLLGQSRFGTGGSGYNFTSITNDNQSCFPGCSPGLIHIPAGKSVIVMISADISPTAVSGRTITFGLFGTEYVFSAERLPVIAYPSFPILGEQMTISGP